MSNGDGPLHRMQGQEILALCGECGRETHHVVITSAEYESEHVDGAFSVQFWDEYQVVECRGCSTRGFRHRHRNTENTDHDIDTGQEFLRETVNLYPPPEVSRQPLRGAEMLPERVRTIYGETLSALGAGLNVLAGIGVRALVESMCKDRNASGGNLEAQIDSLVRQGVVSADGSEILHSLRIMGNEAAHEVKPHSLGDLDIAMSVVEHALQGIYILPAQSARLPRRSGQTPGE